MRVKGKEGVLLSVSSKSSYNKNLLRMLRDLKGQRVCIVSLSKSGKALRQQLKREGLPLGKVHIVDGVSRQDEKVQNVSTR